MGQVSTRGVKLATVVRSPAFRRGFQDYVTGKPPAFDHEWSRDSRIDSTSKMWAYERGRHFGAWCAGCGLQLDPAAWFINKRLSWRVLDAARDAQSEGAIR